MRIKCAQETLAEGLSIVGRAVQARGTLPVLGNVLLSTDGSRLKMAATNLEIGITCWMPAEVHEEGMTTVPARLLGEFVGSLPRDQVETALNSRTGTVNLRCSAYEANIKVIDAEEFPPIPRVDEGETILADPRALHSAINHVVFATASEDGRPALTGVLMSFSETSATFAAADGFRLAVRQLPISRGPDQPLEVIVPARALQELARILGNQEDPVEIAVTPNRNQVLFHLQLKGADADVKNEVELVSRLIEGKFPAYQQIIPTSHLTRVVIDAKNLQSAARVGSYFARESLNILRLEIVPGEELTPGRLVIRASAADVGDTEVGFDVVVEGEPTQIAFNVKYLTDVLSVIDAAQVSLEVTSPSRPGVIKPVGDDGYIYVIMPMHVNR